MCLCLTAVHQSVLKMRIRRFAKRRIYPVAFFLTLFFLVYNNVYSGMDFVLHMCDSADYYFSADPKHEHVIHRAANVCIENPHNNHIRRYQKIVIYGQKENRSGHILKVHGFDYDILIGRNNWKVDLVTGDIPKGHRIINGTAFFIFVTFPGNIFHFLQETFHPLFSMIHKLGLLCENSKKYFLYSHHDTPRINMNHKQYEWFLQFLNVDLSHDNYYETTSHTCFTEAVFGNSNLYKEEFLRIPVDTIREATPRRTCPPNQALIIKRARRKMLNFDQIVKTVAEVGYQPVITQFEKMTVQEQVLLAKCSSLIIGIQGAALQWGQFMNPGSTVIEIIWPDLYWPSFFGFLEKYDINVKQLTVSRENVHLNWTSYEKEVHHGRRLSERQRKTYFVLPPRSVIYDNIWKWADVNINIDKLRNLLKDLKR